MTKTRPLIAKQLLLTTLAGITACVFFAAHPTLARAGILDASCIGEESVTYSPGLTNTLVGNLDACEATDGLTGVSGPFELEIVSP